jgi:hypothetical protein
MKGVNANMSLKSAIELCQLKVSMAISASTKEAMLSAAREAEFALTVLAESVENKGDNEGRNHWSIQYLPPISSIEDAPWPEGDSDDNPEAETPLEKRNREEMKNRGFFG